MMGGTQQMRGLLDQDSRKASNIGATLGRLVGYFGRYWYMILLALFFVVISTWASVITPQLSGQAVDCFLVPIGNQAFGSFLPGGGTQVKTDSSNCWVIQNPDTLSGTNKVIATMFSLGTTG